MNYFKRASTLAASLLLLTAFGLSLQACARPGKSKPRVNCSTASPPWVNDGVVLESEVDEQLASVKDRLRTQGQQMPPTP